MEDNIIENVENLFRLRKEITKKKEANAVKDVKNPFQLTNENKEIK